MLHFKKPHWINGALLTGTCVSLKGCTIKIVKKKIYISFSPVSYYTNSQKKHIVENLFSWPTGPNPKFAKMFGESLTVTRYIENLDILLAQNVGPS